MPARTNTNSKIHTIIFDWLTGDDRTRAWFTFTRNTCSMWETLVPELAYFCTLWPGLGALWLLFELQQNGGGFASHKPIICACLVWQPCRVCVSVCARVVCLCTLLCLMSCMEQVLMRTNWHSGPGVLHFFFPLKHSASLPTSLFVSPQVLAQANIMWIEWDKKRQRKLTRPLAARVLLLRDCSLSMCNSYSRYSKRKTGKCIMVFKQDDMKLEHDEVQS